MKKKIKICKKKSKCLRIKINSLMNKLVKRTFSESMILCAKKLKVLENKINNYLKILKKLTKNEYNK